VLHAVKSDQVGHTRFAFSCKAGFACFQTTVPLNARFCFPDPERQQSLTRLYG